jgi:hypothetical protein
MPIYIAHLIDHAGRSRYVEYHDLAIDVIVDAPLVPLAVGTVRDDPLHSVQLGAWVTAVRFVRADPPEVDDMGLPIFREVAEAHVWL